MAEAKRAPADTPTGLLYARLRHDPVAFRALSDATDFDFNRELIYVDHQLNDHEWWLCLYCGMWGGSLQRSCPEEHNGRGFDLCMNCPFATSWPWSQESFRRRLVEYEKSVGRPVHTPPAERREMAWFNDL